MQTIKFICKRNKELTRKECIELFKCEETNSDKDFGPCAGCDNLAMANK